MSEFIKLYDEEFFIINSDDLKRVSSKLYGFTFINNNIIFNSKDIDEKQLDGTGTYIYVTKKDDKITIFQDFNGCYGLYYYFNEETNFFAISNSFLKLVEYLKEKTILTLNRDYANTYISSNFCSPIYKKTLVNEIEQLPKNVIVNIDISTKSINFSKIDYHEREIDVNSKEGMVILDYWFYKWVNIINNTYANTDSIIIDLSGGFDSRLVLSLVLSSDIDLNKIQVNSNVSDNKTFIEDYEIASQIAKDFGFKLNQNELNVPKYYFQELESSINLSYYTKLGFTKQMYWKLYKYTSKVFHMTGYGGGLIRYFYDYSSVDEYINSNMHTASKYSIDFKSSVKNMLEYTFQEYSKEVGEIDIADLLLMHYKYTRNRYHFGKASVESFLTNHVFLNPLMDPWLSKLKIQNLERYKYLLIALIFSRYNPKLLEYKFQGKREIDAETLELAKNINEKYPFKKDEIKFFKPEKNEDLNKDELSPTKQQIKWNDQYKLVKKGFASDSFKEIFSMYFPKKVYQKIYEDESKLKLYNPLNEVNAAVGTLKIIEDIEYSHLKDNKTIYKWLYNIPNFPTKSPEKNTTNKYNFLKKYNIARMDIKNNGNENNNLEVIEISDKESMLLKPNWFKDKTGTGIQIESSSNSLDIKLKAIKDGKLFIFLKSKYMTDNDEILPIHIKYKSVTVNSIERLKKPKLATCSNPITITNNVKDDETIEIHLEWELLNVEKYSKF